MDFLPFLVLAVLALAVYQLAGYRRRRLLYSFWRRTIRWEYWPMWAFYFPVAIFVLLLCLRHRGLTLVSAANSGLEDGGVALVSKGELLGKLAREPELIASFALVRPDIESAEKQKILSVFLADNRLDYPIILKPNFGERGRGVRIVDDEAAALDYLGRCREPMIAQEYVPGPEYGVYYLRHPGEKRGRVLSVTAKHPAYVTGDGVRSLEHLILDDPRMVCFGRLLLDVFHDRLGEVLPAGERFTLTELRSHWRGSLFEEAEEVRTPALEDVFDRLSHHVDGFYVGRYDVRAPSPDELRHGRGFKVIELNSVMSEPIHMYDARYSLFGAYAIMFGLWKEIVAIGAANRARGAKVLSVREFAQIILDYRSHRRAQL